MGEQWNANWDFLMTGRFARCQPDLVMVEINLIPSQRGEIAKPLPGVKTEQYETPPFRRGYFVQTLKFGASKGTPCRFTGLLENCHGSGGIIGNEVVPSGRSK